MKHVNSECTSQCELFLEVLSKKKFQGVPEIKS